MKGRSAVVIACIWTLAQTTPASCYHGKFPGIGSPTQWRKAVEVCNAGVAKLHAHNADAAIALFKKAISMYPEDPDFYGNLALAYENEKKDFATAEKYFQKAMNMAPTDAAYLLGYGGMLFDKGDITATERTLAIADKYLKTPIDRQRSAKLHALIVQYKQVHSQGKHG